MSAQIVLFEETVGPATPGTGESAMYFKVDSRVYIKDDAGVELQLSTSKNAIAMAVAMGVAL